MRRGRTGGKVSEGTRFLSDETIRKNRERAREYIRRKRSADPVALALTAQHDEMVAELGAAVCAICGGVENGRRLSIDHDHATGLVRGLLCRRCNAALGLLDDSPERLEAAAEYLRRHALNPGTRQWVGPTQGSSSAPLSAPIRPKTERA